MLKDMKEKQMWLFTFRVNKNYKYVLCNEENVPILRWFDQRVLNSLVLSGLIDQTKENLLFKLFPYHPFLSIKHKDFP